MREAEEPQWLYLGQKKGFIEAPKQKFQSI